MSDNEQKPDGAAEEAPEAATDGTMEESPGEAPGEAPEETPEYTAPISAVPPRVIMQEESQMEVSASPAFQCLDDLFQDGKLTGTKVAMLKAKYTELHEMLKSTRENESSLLQQAKDFQTELERQKSELEKADDFPENSNSETSKLRMQLLKQNNDLSQADERQYQLDYKIECLQEEKKMIEREYSRMPKEGEMEKKLEELKTMCADMKKEIGQRKTEAKTLKEEVEKKTRLMVKESKEFEKTHEEHERLKSELVAVNTQPGQISKEADRVQRHKNDAEKKHRELKKELNSLMTELSHLQARQSSLVDEKLGLDEQMDQKSSSIQDQQREFQVLVRDNEHAKEREAVLMGDRATLDLNLRHINLEKKTMHDSHTRKMRDKDRELRNWKKAELQLKVAEDGLAHTQQVHEKVKGQNDMQPKDDGSLLQKRQELQREVEANKRQLSMQNSITATETVKVEQSIAEEERLLYEQSDLRIEVVELTRLAAIKNDEREQKARDFMRAEMRYHRAVQDLKTKQLEIQDKQKKYQEMQQKLKEFAKLYDVIKNERNKCVNLIQTSTQKAAEMREKIKILQNEIEILRTAVAQKDRQLQKQRLKHVNAITIRDSLRNEVAKQHRIEHDMSNKKEQQRMDIAKLNLLINQNEEIMVDQRKRYEKAVQNRNDRGIQLIERDEEVCIFYEKVNIQEQMIRNGDVELQAREEEIRFLKMQLAEEKRAVDLLRKSLPNKHSLEQELVTVQIQLAQCQDRMMELEKLIQNPHDAERVRFLEGKDLSPADAQQKLEELEIRLAEKEEQLLEKDLIFEQDCRIVERVHRKVNAGKDDTLNLAKTVNEQQSRIKEVTRKMMAMVSELSMHQAQALRLQQDVKEREAELEHAYLRMEKDEAPTEVIEREWLRKIRDEHRRLQDKEASRMAVEEEEQYQLPGGISTTAEPRPNAYIPDDDADLPIPRPYGSHAPFKPNEPGSTMRHIRKPIPKPIEI